jgi:glucose-6-phosphate 1-dehydrogenase
MARAQDLSDVLNPQYVPQITAAYDLFWEKQKFLYAILEAKVETAKGKSIIRQYKNTYDAQKAYEKLEEHHLTSNTAMFAANKIMEYLTSVRINDRSWHGTLANFIIHWQEQFRRYNV